MDDFVDLGSLGRQDKGLNVPKEWPRDVVVARLAGLRSDFNDMLESHADVIAGEIQNGFVNQEDAEGYLDGMQAAVEEIYFCLQNRFSELEKDVQEREKALAAKRIVLRKRGGFE